MVKLTDDLGILGTFVVCNLLWYFLNFYLLVCTFFKNIKRLVGGDKHVKNR